MSKDGNACVNNAVMLYGGEEIEQAGMLVEVHRYQQDEDVSMIPRERMEEESRPQKRTRVDEEENEWTMVGSKGKKTKAENNSIEVYISSSEILPKQFAIARIFKNNNIYEIETVKYINPFKIRLSVPNEICAKKLENCTEFKDKGWRIYRALEKDISYGIIKGVDLDLPNDEIFKCIECPNQIDLISVMRLDRRCNTAENGWTPSECVRLCFKGAELPSYILVDGLRIKVEPYVFRVSQCSKCWRLGHILRRCPSSKVICPKCSGNHENCTTTTYRCVNCDGNHMAMSKRCPIYLKERKLREIMAEENCTYKKALTVYAPAMPGKSSDMPERSSSPVFPTTSKKVPNTNSSEPTLCTETPSYAHVLRTSATIHKAPNPQNTPKLTRPQRRQTQEAEEIYTESEDLPNFREKEDFNSQKKRISFLELLYRLKNILFLKGIAIQAKIKNMVKCLLEWVLSALMDYVSDWSLFKTIIDSLYKNG